MDRIVLVTKPTRRDELVQKHLTEGATRFSLESRGQSFKTYQQEHEIYTAALAQIRSQIPSELPVATVTRAGLPHFLFRENDLVVVCGPDGLFANLAKYTQGQLILTINPDPNSVAGTLMLFPPSAVGQIITLIKQGKHRVESLPLVRASVDDDQVLWGINDIFIGRSDHISARYELDWNQRRERQSSSGILVSTGVGATGWIRSIATMVAALSSPDAPQQLSRLPKATNSELVFVVREPFPSPTTGTTLITGRITPDRSLVVHSEMPEGGCLFSDGVVEKKINWNAGSTATISVGQRYVSRIIP